MPDAGAFDAVAFGVHLGPQAARAVVAPKGAHHRSLSGWGGLLAALVPGVVAAWHLQHRSQLAYRHLRPVVVDEAAAAQRVSWLKMATAFFKMSRIRCYSARNARTSGSRANSALPNSVAACWSRQQ